MTITRQFELLPEVTQFLSSGPLKSFVGGKWVSGSAGKTFQALDPGSGEKLADVEHMQPDDVDRAVQAAAKAFRETPWRSVSPSERGAHLHRLADAVEKQLETIAQIEALDCGKLLAHARGDVQNFINTMRYYTELSLHTQRRSPIAVAHYEAWTALQPWGPCGFIFPWNFPFLLLGWNISPALAAGNTVVVKPAEDTPLSTLYICKIAQQVGIPDGVINVVAGFGEPTGAALAQHPGIKRMSFTGSPEVGKFVGQACGANLVPVKLELGGKGAAVVFDDVDIDQTADSLTQAITFHTGQVCCDATRWLIQDSIHDRFLEAVLSKMKAVRIGHGFAPDTQMGPVVSETQRKRVLSYLERGQKQGAQLLLEGGACKPAGFEGGFYVKPAVLAGPLDNVAAREEIFGPVAYVARFKNEAHAIELANDTAYGLANSVWTTDLDRAARVAERMVAGNSWINAHNVFPIGVPYAGVNLSGFGGGVNSPQTFYDYLRPQSIVRPL